MTHKRTYRASFLVACIVAFAVSTGYSLHVQAISSSQLAHQQRLSGSSFSLSPTGALNDLQFKYAFTGESSPSQQYWVALQLQIVCGKYNDAFMTPYLLVKSGQVTLPEHCGFWYNMSIMPPELVRQKGFLNASKDLFKGPRKFDPSILRSVPLNRLSGADTFSITKYTPVDHRNVGFSVQDNGNTGVFSFPSYCFQRLFYGSGTPELLPMTVYARTLFKNSDSCQQADFGAISVHRYLFGHVETPSPWEKGTLLNDNRGTYTVSGNFPTPAKTFGAGTTATQPYGEAFVPKDPLPPTEDETTFQIGKGRSLAFMSIA